MNGENRQAAERKMKPFDRPIKVREEFFYEVLLPHIFPSTGERIGWDIDLDVSGESPYVQLKGLQHPDGRWYSLADAEKLILDLHRNSKLAPFYVYAYEGTHHQRTDGRWTVTPAVDMKDAVKRAGAMADPPATRTVWVYANTEGMDELLLPTKTVWIMPYKVRFVEIRDYGDVSLWEADFADFSDARAHLSKLSDAMYGVGTVYARVYMWRRGHGKEGRQEH